MLATSMAELHALDPGLVVDQLADTPDLVHGIQELLDALSAGALDVVGPI